VKVLFWAAAVTKLGGLRVLEKKRYVPLVGVLLKEGLKMENSMVSAYIHTTYIHTYIHR
jgi:hypothetical protein